MLMRLRDVTNGVKIHKEYKYNKKKYEDCIVASEVVDWLLRNELEIVRLQRERGRYLFFSENFLKKLDYLELSMLNWESFHVFQNSKNSWMNQFLLNLQIPK